MGSLARKMRRKKIREGQSQDYIMQLVKNEVERNFGSAEQKAIQMSNKDLSAGTVWVIAALVKAIDVKFKWKRRSDRYYQLMTEFTKQYTDLLESDNKDAWIREAEDIVNMEFNIYFH